MGLGSFLLTSVLVECVADCSRTDLDCFSQWHGKDVEDACLIVHVVYYTRYVFTIIYHIFFEN